jgi:hypothetical protein
MTRQSRRRRGGTTGDGCCEDDGAAVLLPLLLVPQAPAQQVDRLRSPLRYRTRTLAGGLRHSWLHDWPGYAKAVSDIQLWLPDNSIRQAQRASIRSNSRSDQTRRDGRAIRFARNVRPIGEALSASADVRGDGGLAHVDAECPQLAMDSRCTPRVDWRRPWYGPRPARQLAARRTVRRRPFQVQTRRKPRRCR